MNSFVFRISCYKQKIINITFRGNWIKMHVHGSRQIQQSQRLLLFATSGFLFYFNTITHVCATIWTSYHIRKTVRSACAGNTGKVFPATDFKEKPLVSDPCMHYGTFLTHVPWCMSVSLTRGGGKNVPGIRGACTTRICFRIWQEAQQQKIIGVHIWIRPSLQLNNVGLSAELCWKVMPKMANKIADIFVLLHPLCFMKNK